MTREKDRIRAQVFRDARAIGELRCKEAQEEFKKQHTVCQRCKRPAEDVSGCDIVTIFPILAKKKNKEITVYHSTIAGYWRLIHPFPVDTYKAWLNERCRFLCGYCRNDLAPKGDVKEKFDRSKMNITF